MFTNTQQFAHDETSRKLLVSEHLFTLGFKREQDVVNVDGEELKYCWAGSLSCLKGLLVIRISISDWNFICLPDVYIEPLNATWLTSLFPLPHIHPCTISVHGVEHYSLCYSLADANELPRSNPQKIINWVLNQAASIINHLSTNEKFRQLELLREIEPIWDSFYCYQAMRALITGNTLIESLHLTVRIENVPDKFIDIAPCHWICHDAQSGQTKEVKTETILVRVHSKKIPSLTWLFKTIGESQAQPYNRPTFEQFLKWLREWDKAAHYSLFQYIQAHWDQIQLRTLIFVCLRVDQALLPAIFFLPSSTSDGTVKAAKKDKYNEITMLIGQSINLNPNFVYSRNLTNMNMNNLSGLHIAIVGCGAIGGYLAGNIARLGAGTGDGALWLIDPDILGSHNIGRHFLGKNYIQKYKSEALKTELEQQLVGLNITAITGSVFSTYFPRLQEKLPKFDLIIDASGKMELSEALTEQWHKWLDKRPTMLHVWIQGNGECVQGLLVKHDTGMACRSCIRRSGFYNSEATLSPLGSNHETKHAFLACHDFTPYIVSASTSAASLATDMVMDWINSTPSPHYRTRYVERWHGHRVESQDVPTSINCPYCQLHSRAN